jgi:hypothetical protein
MRLLDTDAASTWLREERGVRRAPTTLRKLRSTGGGPRYRLLNRRPYYTPEDLGQWVDARLSAPIDSTSAAETAPPADKPRAPDLRRRGRARRTTTGAASGHREAGVA